MLSTFDAGVAASLVVPLMRLMATMAASLVVAQALETFGWTAYIARLAAPLVRFANLGPISGAAFSVSFASSTSANALLGEGMVKGEIETKELVLANIINSTPAFFIHLPSMLAAAYAFLGNAAWSYVGLVFAAAVLRTLVAVVVARLVLPSPKVVAAPLQKKRGATLAMMFARFKKRMIKLCVFTVPIYCIVFALQHLGAFKAVEAFVAARADALFFLHPGAIGVVVLFLAADSGAAFAAAASLIHGGTITPDQAVLALLAGNILASPMRAFRHQMPSYAGFFTPRTALLLVGINQTFRAATLALAAFGFYLALGF